MTNRVLQSAVAAFLVGLLLAGCASYDGARLYQSGTRALDRGEPERAIEQLERAAELVPAASEVQNHLGLAYAAAGREDDALLAFRRAVDLDCDNHAAADNLRVAEHRAGGGGRAVSGDDRSWLDGEKKSFSELDRQRREGGRDGERRPGGKAAQERSAAATKQYLRDIDGVLTGGSKAEIEKLAAAMRDAHGTPGLADACRAYHAAVGLPDAAPLISLFLDTADRELVLVGLAALREGQASGSVKPTSSLRSQLRILAEDADDAVAETAEELLDAL